MIVLAPACWLLCNLSWVLFPISPSTLLVDARVVIVPWPWLLALVSFSLSWVITKLPVLALFRPLLTGDMFLVLRSGFRLEVLVMIRVSPGLGSWVSGSGT